MRLTDRPTTDEACDASPDWPGAVSLEAGDPRRAADRLTGRRRLGRRVVQTLIRSGGIALAYCALGLLVMRLQPGQFPLPVFPSSGVALAALLIFGWRLWPAVWLAGFGFATYALFGLGGELTARDWAAAVVIATGVTLEATVGRWLVLTALAFPTALDTPREVGLFQTLGGPVACLIGASVSVFGLTWLGVFAAPEWAPHWLSWWLGDSLGVLVGAPLSMIVIARPRAIWGPRLLSVAPLLVLSAALIASLMLQVGPLDVGRQQATFRQESERLRGEIQAAVRSAGESGEWVRRIHGMPARDPRYNGLAELAQALRQRHDAIEATLWLVPSAGADAGHSGPPVWTVAFAEPPAALATVAAVKGPLSAALATLTSSEAAAQGPARMLPLGARDANGANKIAVLQPFERPNESGSVSAQGVPAAPSAYLVLVLDLAHAAAQSDLPDRGWRLCLTPGTGDAGAEPDAAGVESVCPIEARTATFLSRFPIDLGEQSWTLVVTALRRSFMLGDVSFAGLVPQVSGLLLTGLCTASLLVLSGNRRRMREIVLDRTRRLDLSARVFESTAEAIVITDAQCRIISVNPAFTSITGYRADEVLGQDPRTFGAGEQETGAFSSRWETLTEHGRWQGERWNRRKNGESFPAWMTISTARGADGAVLNYIATFTDISQQKQAAEHIHHLAYFDALTGLANRTLLELRGSQALATAEVAGHLLAVLFLDVDRFKTINDSLGHLAGDQLLQTVAERLRRSVRDEDTVARLGGDEFVVLLANLKRREEAALLARRIIDAVALPTRIENQEIAVTVSIGISLYPYDGPDFANLVKNADVALYKAKEAGRNNVQFFDAAMSAHSFERLVLENALRGALDRDELMLYFQPQVNIATGLVVGAEALLRWQHPHMGIIGPKRFIHLAEEGGMIAAIGEWVIRTVCRTLARWEADGIPCTTIAVNISALQFKEDLADLVQDALDASGISPRLLELELTESLLMASADESVQTLKKLYRMGVRLSIDDFGTGYSSLSYLKRFPIQKLKIDQSFIREIPGDSNDEAITRTIIGLANNLHLRVVAEGVETQAQSDFLYAVGCHEIQGSHVAQPMPSTEFAAWMSDRGKRRYSVA